MPNHVVTKTVTSEGSLATVTAEMETWLETKDSTNDTIHLIDIILQPNGSLIGVISTHDTTP